MAAKLTTLLGCETCSTESTAAALQKRRRFSNPTMNPIKHNKNSRENLERIALNCCVFWLFKTLICWSDEFSELYRKPRFLLTISIIKKPYCKRAGTDEKSKRRKSNNLHKFISHFYYPSLHSLAVLIPSAKGWGEEREPTMGYWVAVRVESRKVATTATHTQLSPVLCWGSAMMRIFLLSFHRKSLV